MYTLITICNKRFDSPKCYDNESLNDLLLYVCFGWYDEVPKFKFKCSLNHIIITDKFDMTHVITGVSYKDLENVKTMISRHFKDLF
jgi:hypothetical protein